MSQELVPARPVSCGLIVPQGVPIHLCPSTLPTDKEGLKQRLNAMGSSSMDLDRDGTLLIEVAHVLAHPRETLNEDSGEMNQHSWLVLIDPKGETWGTSSPVVAEKVAQLLALRSAGLIDWPVSLHIVTRTGRKSGRRYHDLIVL